jgi:FkbM family methyltransferase
VNEKKQIVRQLRRALRIVPLTDLVKYHHLIAGNGQPLSGVRIKKLDNDTVFARPGTEDYLTLYYVFYNQFHLPPARLTEAPVILDLGCNCGYTIAHYKRLYPDACVIGVEMDEDNLAVARRNVGGMTNVQLLHCAVSHKEGVVAYDKQAKEDAYRIEPTGGMAASHLKTVTAMTMPSIIQRFGLSRIDFLKLDIEGEEVNVFGAAQDLGWLDAVRALNMEVHAEPAVLQQMLAMIEQRGFRAWKDTNHWSAIMAVRQ